MLLNVKMKRKKLFNRNDVTHSQFTLLRSVLGYLSLYSKETASISLAELESIRLGLKRLLKKHTKITVCSFQVKTKTKKANGSRLGKGKGAFKYYYVVFRAGNPVVNIKTSSTKAITSLANRNVSFRNLPFVKSSR